MVPHTFQAVVHMCGVDHTVEFSDAEGHAHGHGHGGDEHINIDVGVRPLRKYERDDNFRAAVIHVAMDAVVSVMVLVALALAGNAPHTLFLDPFVGVIGSFVILSWGFQLIVDTSSTLLDKNPDLQLTEKLRQKIERDGSVVTDLHVWRLGPGQLGAIVSVLTDQPRVAEYYHSRLAKFKAIKHLTVEVKTTV